MNGTVFIGSWDGYEYALRATNGTQLWKTFLGVENFTNKSYGCPWATPLGVTSSAAVCGGSVYVGSFYNYYSLSATTGSILWNQSIDPSSSPAVSDGYYSWSSPLFYNGNVYVGVSSQCDNPLIVGKVLELSRSTGAIVHSYSPVGGNLGGSVWSSLTIDGPNNTVWATTGNGPTSGYYGESMIALNATTLAFLGAWTVPSGPPDIDFGAGATPFSAGPTHKYVVATNKDGYAYAIDRFNAHAGPVWQKQTTTFPGLSSCQPPGQAISPATYDGNMVYLGSSYTSIGGVNVNGSVRAVFPGNGTFKWQAVTLGTVQAGLVSADGLVVDVSRLFTYTADPHRQGCYNFHNSPNSWLQVLNASSGNQLFSFHTPYIFAGSPAIADGRIFVGAGINSTTNWDSKPNHQGHVYAFGIPIGSSGSNLRPYSYSTSYVSVNGFGNITGGMPNYNYSWAWGDGTTSYGRYPQKTFYATSSSTVILTVTDAAGESTMSGWIVYDYVYICNGGLSVCATAGVTPCYTVFQCFPSYFHPISLFASSILGGIGSLSYDWNFGDGTAHSAVRYPSHTYSTHGTYIVTVTVTDSEHNQASKQFQVTF